MGKFSEIGATPEALPHRDASQNPFLPDEVRLEDMENRTPETGHGMAWELPDEVNPDDLGDLALNSEKAPHELPATEGKVQDGVGQQADTGESENNKTEGCTEESDGGADAKEKEPADQTLEKIKEDISTPEGLQRLMERHPELADKWKAMQEAIDTLNDPDATALEKRSAEQKLERLKGSILEIAAKDALSEAGLDVEDKQRTTKGESGATRPDIIAKNNTDHPITVFGVTVQPGGTISVECKCGKDSYLSSELNSHIPNQLSGHEGKSVLLISSPSDAIKSKAQDVCDQRGTTLAVLDVSASDVDNAIKGVNN